MNPLLVFAPPAMVVLAVVLSITAFQGGYHFAHYNFLKKMKPFHDKVFNGKDVELMREANNFYEEISVKNNKPKFLDWLKFGVLGMEP